LPQIFAGGALGHDPFGAGSVVVCAVGPVVVVGGAAVVVVGADVVGGAVVVAGGAGSVVVAVAVGSVAGGVVVGSVVGGVVVGSVVGVEVAPMLATLKSPRRLEVVPSAHVSTTRMLCEPSASLVVSYGRAVPSAAVPTRSNGADLSVRIGRFVRRDLSG
jgi:hypothetical protein